MSLLDENKESHIIRLLDIKSQSKPPQKQHLLSDLLNDFLPPQEAQADEAFTKGTKLICNLLSEGSIDHRTAKNVLDHFVQLYADYKIESAIRKFLEKREDYPLLNTLKFYLEKE